MLYGFDVGGSKIELAVFDAALTCIWSKRVATPQDDYQKLLDVFCQLVTEADEQCHCQGPIGIGIPGIVKLRDKSVFTTNINVAKGRPLIRDLEQRLARPIRVNNDANCFALSEASAYPDYHNVLGVILGTGLGGGLVVDHQIVSGLNGCAGEIGHSKLFADAFTILGHDIPLLECGCGLRGCCERYLSGTGFEWLYQHFYQQSLPAKAIIAAYYANQANARAHVDRYLELLAAYLANIMMILDAELIVIGGGLSNFDAIYPQLPGRMQPYLLSMMKAPRIEKARYGDAGGARGAALLWLK